ncbi:MAG TPA: hypothetical protein VHX36_08335 [Candidatus Acidoferrales bacterium]|nr:hypothetical protein [Candidatus Acidoferrales bacterium]
MTEFIRKDKAIVPDQTTAAAPMNPDSRALVTPPPSDVRSAGSVATGSPAGAATARAVEEERVALFPSGEANDLRARWDSIQVGFVDEPRKAVAEADALVSATMTRLSEIFSGERQRLEEQWGRSQNPSTEDFRVALRRYRSFFSRLLSI